jgi:ribosomal protein S18 acetylase RimI-like enzyme
MDYRILTLEDLETATQVISEAFIDDPLCTFMLPYRRGRVKTLQKFFRLYAEISIQQGGGFGSGNPLQGVAFWELPNQPEISIIIKSVGRILPLVLSMYPIGFVRARSIFQQIDVLHKRYVDQPHYYLDNIGVLTSARGKGVASKLIWPILKMADEQKMVVYTDTVTRSNVPFYEHFGFNCEETTTIPKTGITVWALRRPIQPG